MISNKKIKNATICTYDNIQFKSVLEKNTYITLKENGFDVKYEYIKFELWPSFQPLTCFYDKETDKQIAKRLKDKKHINKSKLRSLILKNTKVSGISYTPDFYFKYNNVDVFIETKGFENDVAYIKKKMFRKILDERLINLKQESLYFELYTKHQLLQAIDIIKNYKPMNNKLCQK